MYAARGACIYATQMISQPKNQEKDTESSNARKRKKNRNTDDLKKGKGGRTWMPSNSPYSVEIGDRKCEVFISDESGKINVNKLTDESRASFVKFLTAYKLEEITAETIADSILDWLDADDMHHLNGAEKDYYATLSEPYEPRNGPFESIEELTLVKGMTPQRFELLRDNLTIYGSGKININFASKEVLLSVPSITEEIAAAIIQVRKKYGKIKKLTILKGICRHFGIIGSEYDKVQNYFTLDNSNYLTINSFSSSGKIKNSYKFFVQKDVGHCSIIAVYPE